MEGEPTSLQDRLRLLPKVDDVLRRPQVDTWVRERGRPLALRAVRHALANVRARAMAGGPTDVTTEDLLTALGDVTRPSLRRVVNATGVVLHTNLGRAPLGPAAMEAAARVATGYCNLEMDLDTGERGSRYVHAAALVSDMLGTEDALVVNNGAAAVLLALSALCAGREAVVSRGELVEIGGGFRIPEVIAQGGARLREVGTTNRTRLQDYARAVGPSTGALLKVHPSNFAMLGFTESVSLAELKTLAQAHAIPVLYDAGTGMLEPPFKVEALSVRQAVEEGADLVTFSGDKLLGGPQAGVMAGRAALVAACRDHPLCRALRVDKLTLAALEATLRLYRDGGAGEVPVVRMLRAEVDGLRTRAQRLRDVLARQGVEAAVRDVRSAPGGGTLPGVEFPSVAVGLSCTGASPDALARRLRQAEPPVVGRVEGGAVLLDLRTVLPEEDEVVARVVVWALAGEGGGALC
jgi:L-seryl-tRNA(Ser) seleniumtransferase